MRSLGAYYFGKQFWREAVESFHRALAINPLYENTWFIMGCAAMRIHEWDTAVKAFNRCININFENGEAWTNLASVYVKQGRKRDAWRAQKEAIKQNFESYRMWENFLVFSVDLGEFADAMEALRQIVELRWKTVVGSGNPSQSEAQIVDIEVLDILVSAIISDTPDAHGVPGICRLNPCGPFGCALISTCNIASILSSKMTTLLDDITSKIATSSLLFLTASRFYEFVHEIAKCLDYKAKAYRVSLNHPKLALDVKVFEVAAQCALDFVDALEKYGKEEGQTEGLLIKDWQYQCRMTLRTLIGRTRDAFESNEWHARMREKLECFKA